ncbi:hypothetical protein [Microlunatus sp. Gsoil 973]|uniref:hypothetical protein n=1 Tax=Microlunatus sp. Gsoil 973 TaxID=2672569 RepID=UPI0012B4865A|nr:hypothetical protein [Microlunatus sp. Gsoil 973]QGN34378.1 hypothetical protein GJV80_17865 [Microlunatus sp. Gsoil 973]
MTESILLWFAFAAGWAVIAAANLSENPAGPPVRITRWGAALWLIVAIPSVAQFAQPRLLALGMRNGDILHHGQWWRIVTANLLQDGGAAGAVSNLTTLAVTLLIVGRAVSARDAISVFVLGGIGSMLLQLHHPGAGNSMATLALLAGTVAIVVVRRKPSPAQIIGSTVVVTIAVVLTVVANEHGPAIMLGLILGVAIQATAMLRRRFVGGEAPTG